MSTHSRGGFLAGPSGSQSIIFLCASSRRAFRRLDSTTKSENGRSEKEARDALHSGLLSNWYTNLQVPSMLLFLAVAFEFDERRGHPSEHRAYFAVWKAETIPPQFVVPVEQVHKSISERMGEWNDDDHISNVPPLALRSPGFSFSFSRDRYSQLLESESVVMLPF
jgi:hypothetical protein